MQKVNLAVYGESLCPDTTGFIRDQLAPVYVESSTLRRHINLTYVAFGKAKCTANATDDFSCSCQHGDNECRMNAMQNCVQHRLQRAQLYAPIVFCLQVHPLRSDIIVLQGRMANARSAADCIPSHLGADAMLACANSAQGRRLLNAAGTATKAQSGLNFVPWIVVNGVRVEESIRDLKRVVCERIAVERRPKQCSV